MEEEKSYQSWTISDEVWEAIKDDIPKRERDPKKKICSCPRSGTQANASQEGAEGIFYVLRTGCQWKALPREYGSASTVHRTFQNWLAAGLFGKSGPRDWKGRMNWKESAGSGKVWMAVW